MTDHFAFMKKYFSDGAWQRLKEIRKHQGAPLVPSAWIEVLMEGSVFMSEDLRGESAQDWAERCHEAWQAWATNDASIQLGFAKAWKDYRNWPRSTQFEIGISEFEATVALAQKAQTYRRMGYHERWKRLRQVLTKSSTLQLGWQLHAMKLSALFQGDKLVTAHGSQERPIWGPIFHKIEEDRDNGDIRLHDVARYIETIQQK
jgi:hypothetical protein